MSAYILALSIVNLFSIDNHDPMFQGEFWLDTYYNTSTGKFHFTKSDL